MIAVIKDGGWDAEDELTSDEMNAFQERLLKALDGVDGGEYELQDDLIFAGPAKVIIANDLLVQSGAFITVEGTADVTGELDIESGGDLNVRPGGRLNLKTGGPGGRAIVESGALVSVEDGGAITLDDGAAINVPAGDLIVEDIGDLVVRDNGEIVVADGGMLNVGDDGDLNVGGTGQLNLLSGGKIVGSSGSEIQINDVDDLKINNDSYVFEVALNPIHVGSQWASEESGTFKCLTVTTANRLVFPIRVPAGDVITTLRMTINGNLAGVGNPHGVGAGPSDRPVLEFGKISISGVYTSLQTIADPTNTGPAYDIPHSVNMSGGVFPYTMTSDRHVVRVIGEGVTGGVANTTRLCSIDGTALAVSVRQTMEVR